jgi:tetratricopeptide (TPR) repeat protein
VALADIGYRMRSVGGAKSRLPSAFQEIARPFGGRRRGLGVILAASLLSIGPLGASIAGAGERQLASVGVGTPGSDLDNLFARLKKAPDEAAAAIASHSIEQHWARSGSDTADLLMQRADAALAAGDRTLAIEILDRIIAIDPDWAEAWNRRATAFYLEDDIVRSANDIREVLAREPRHFGALMGLAGILERIGDERKALEVYERVLDIYPLLAGAQKGVERLKAKYADVPI